MSAPTVADVVRAAERSAKVRPRPGAGFWRLVLGALLLQMPGADQTIVRRGLAGVRALRQWIAAPERLESELRGLIVEVCIEAIADDDAPLQAEEIADWLEALGVEVEPAEAEAA